VRNTAIQRIHAARPRRDASRGALAVAPPRYGIEFLDSGAVHAAAARGTQGAGGPLPHLEAIQKSFGAHDVTGIRAYTGAAATEASLAMGASAFAWGDKVGFAGAPGLRTAAHEAAHVVQQRAGVHLKSRVGEAGDRYEQQADAVAERVVQGRSAEALLGPVASGAGPASPAVQRSVGFEFELRADQWHIWMPAAKGEGRSAPEKGTPVIYGEDFQLQAEYSGANLAVVEMVTNEPGLQTRDQFDASLKDMQRVGKAMDKVEPKTAVRADQFAGGDPNFVMEKQGKPAIDSASMQVTVGVPLASVPALFENLKAVMPQSALPNYEQPLARARKLVGKKSEDYRGFVVLLQQYLSQLSAPGTKEFVKRMIPVMARTDFSRMFALLPPRDREAILDDVDAWVKGMLVAAELEPDQPLVTPVISDPGSADPAMRIDTTRREWLSALPKTDLLTYEGRPGKSHDVKMFPERSPQQILKEWDKDAPKEKQDEVLKRYSEASDRQTTKWPLGKPQTPSERYGVGEGNFTEEMLEPIKNLYEGLGRLGGKTDFIEYAGEEAEKDAPVDPQHYTAAPILEIRDPPTVGKVDEWHQAAKNIYDAVENAILYPQGKGFLTKKRPFRNVLTPGQTGRQQAVRAQPEKLNDRYRRLGKLLKKAPKNDVEVENKAFRILSMAAREAGRNRMGSVRLMYAEVVKVLPAEQWSERMREVDGAIDELIAYHQMDQRSVGAGNLYISAYGTLKRLGITIE
jgi:hypothetical protein